MEDDTGTVYSWGWNDSSQLGTGGTYDQLTPYAVKSLPGQKVCQVSTGISHTAFLTDTGNLYCAGKGTYGRLGIGSSNSNNARTPSLVSFFSTVQRRVIFVACGHYHTACITSHYEMYTWGKNDRGQLGIGTNVEQGLPQLVETLKGNKVFQIACGMSHTLAVTDKQEIFAFGRGDSGELGLGDNLDRFVPTKIESNEIVGLRVVSISCGLAFSGAILGTSLFMWGKNDKGQLGLGHVNSMNKPTQVTSLKDKNLLQLSCGQNHAGVLTDIGHVLTWGSGEFGQLGSMPEIEVLPNAKELSPLRVKEALFKKRAIYISCGGYHTAVIVEGGEVYLWGLNDYGQLGNGSNNRLSQPWHIRGVLQNQCITQLSCGGRHTVVATAFKPLIVVPEGVLTFGNLYNSDLLSDISIKCEDHLIPAHKIILSRASLWRQTFQNNPTMKELTLTNIRLPVLTSLLEYLYTDKVNIQEEKKGQDALSVELLSAANTFGIPHLKQNLEFVVNLGPDWRSAVPKVPETLAHDLKKYINNPELSDIILECEETQFYAHKAILASRSDHFRALFAGQFKEKEDTVIPFDYPASVFNSLLEYIYTESVDIDDSDAVELMSAANEFSLERLKCICEQFVGRGVDIENVAWLFEICDRIEARQLKDFCLYYLTKEFDTVSETDAFKQLPADIHTQISKLRKPSASAKGSDKKKENCLVQ